MNTFSIDRGGKAFAFSRRCLAVLLTLVASFVATAADAGTVAVFPLGGDADEELRAKVGYSLRAKLGRLERFEVIDGPMMADVAAASPEPITSATAAEKVVELAKVLSPDILIWGDLTNADGGSVLKLRIQEKGAPTRSIEKTIARATDLRFAIEEVIETLPGVAPHEHPSEVAVQNDATAEALWETNPNLVINGGFDQPGHWDGIYMADKYAVRFSDALPETDRIVIYRSPARGEEEENHVLAMNLSRTAAENNGLACLSEAIPIEPGTRYRLSFRYRSDGPKLHVFVKGYTTAENIKGEKAEREIYRRQVPPTGATDGEWVTIVDELNPQHVTFPVEHLRVDLYAYLHPGIVMFDDVVLKAVGQPTREAKDKAIDQPVTRPAQSK